MDKQQVISFIQSQLSAGSITQQDILNLTAVPSAQPTQTQVASSPQTTPPLVEEHSSKNLTNIFYGIGGVIVLTGIGILVGQHWNEIGFVGRVLVTLGISALTYIVALLLNSPSQRVVSQVLFVISAVLAPMGSFVVLDQAQLLFDINYQILVSFVLFIIYGLALLISKRSILILLAVGFITWTYYAVLFKIFDVSLFNSDFFKWAGMLAGLSYILIGYASQASSPDIVHERRSVSGMLYWFGTGAILGAGITMGGVGSPWDFIFIFVIFAAFYASVFLRSRGILVLAATFLIVHIVKLTSQYFLNSISWPVALVVCGFFVMGVGYATFYLSKNYIPKA